MCHDCADHVAITVLLNTIPILYNLHFCNIIIKPVLVVLNLTNLGKIFNKDTKYQSHLQSRLSIWSPSFIRKTINYPVWTWYSVIPCGWCIDIFITLIYSLLFRARFKCIHICNWKLNANVNYKMNTEIAIVLCHLNKRNNHTNSKACFFIFIQMLMFEPYCF